MNSLVIFTYSDGDTAITHCDEADCASVIAERTSHTGLVSYSIYQLVSTYTKETVWTAKNS